MSLRMSDRRAFGTQLFATGFTMLIAIACGQQTPTQPDAMPRALDSGASSALRLPDADHGGLSLTASLTGAAEAPGPGDPDGRGTAVITLNHGQAEVCFELTAANIAPATAAHIHVAPVGVPGPVVVPLTPPTDGSSSGCLSVDRQLIKELMQQPDEYYVNVHNAAFPAGAIRGQLSR